MTDNEIKKAMECCLESDCYNCPYDYFTCDNHLIPNALDLINRQKAEIERLNGCVKSEDEVRAIANATIQAGIGIIKAEAIKEFAEGLKAKIDVDLSCGVDSADYLDDVLPKDIDNLVKEMVGED